MYYLRRVIISSLFAFLLFPIVESNAQGEDGNNSQRQKSLELQQNQQSENSSVSDEQLKKFAKVSVEMQEVRREKMKEIEKAIQDEGLTKKRYQNLQRQQMGRGQKKESQRQKGESNGASKKEKKKFQRAQKKVKAIQNEMRKEMKKIIKDHGLTMTEFRKLGRAVRTDKQLQQKFRKMRKKQMNSSG